MKQLVIDYIDATEELDIAFWYFDGVYRGRDDQIEPWDFTPPNTALEILFRHRTFLTEDMATDDVPDNLDDLESVLTPIT